MNSFPLGSKTIFSYSGNSYYLDVLLTHSGLICYNSEGSPHYLNIAHIYLDICAHIPWYFLSCTLCFQLTVSGANGTIGLPALGLVGLGRRDVHEHVLTHHQQMAARIVWETKTKLENAVTESAQVCYRASNWDTKTTISRLKSFHR